jgi:antitoxin (DNA-binding transcriptional repressor) of toxin-antitoxin stability system
MSKSSIELRDIGARLAELTPLIRAGEIITLCEGKQPVAEIRPLDLVLRGRRPFGLARGTFAVPVSFGADDPEMAALLYGPKP